MSNAFHSKPRVDGDSAEEIERDVLAIGRIEAVSPLLRLICETTGMRFAAVARVTSGTWTACAVRDEIEFGLKPGGQLALDTTLCKEVREARQPIVIGQVSTDAIYCTHHTPQQYGFESYISVPILLPDGSYFGNLCALDPAPAKLGEPRILSLFSLFAELIGAQLENDRRREAAQAAVLDERAAGELREQFVAILGHDLRNPLAAVNNCALVVQQKSQDPQVVGMADRILSSVKRMSGLIEDVLDLTRSRLGGGFQVQLKSVDGIDKSLGDVVTELRDAYPGRAIEARMSVAQTVRCDAGRIQQLVSNLVANALVHGAQDSPVSFNAEVQGIEWVLTVSNQGDPIPPESLDQIFSPFWRSVTAVQREGLGLGLYISAQIVRAHGGALTVTSSAQDGTTFVARLPLEPKARS